MAESFTWVDGERLVRFGPGAIGEAADLIVQRGLAGYALLTTERAAAVAPAVVAGAAEVLEIPPGQVPEAAADVRPGVRAAVAAGAGAVVALGGGRVVDVAKAVAAADGLACAAIPTTLAGSPMTPIHRLPGGVVGVPTVRPSLVVWDPDLHSTLPRAQLAATALNALAHAFESLYAPLANPVCALAALRAAELIGAELPRAEPDRPALALGALLGGYAVGATGLAVHHAICQTAVRTLGLPHAETNAVVLAHSAAFVAPRAPAAVGRFAAALGDVDGRPEDASGRIARLTAETGVGGLGELGLDAAAIPELAEAVTRHPALARTPGPPPTAADVAAILRAAL